jgi:hypothetical protein
MESREKPPWCRPSSGGVAKKIETSQARTVNISLVGLRRDIVINMYNLVPENTVDIQESIYMEREAQNAEVRESREARFA